MELPRLCLIHVPKTAGTAVRQWLRGIYPEPTIFDRQYVQHFDEVTDEELAAYRLYLGHIAVLYARRRLPGDTELVTVLRQPVERVLSQYFFTRDNAPAALADDLLAPQQRDAMERILEVGIVEYLETDLPGVKASTRNQQLRILTSPDHMRAVQAGDSAPTITAAIETLESMLVYGVQEELAFFGSELSRALGVQAGPIPATNVNEAKASSADALPAAELRDAKSLIAELNAPEIELYREITQRVRARQVDQPAVRRRWFGRRA